MINDKLVESCFYLISQEQDRKDYVVTKQKGWLNFFWHLNLLSSDQVFYIFNTALML